MKQENKQMVREILRLTAENRIAGGAAEMTGYLLTAFFPFLMVVTALTSGIEGAAQAVGEIWQWLPGELQTFLGEYSRHVFGLPTWVPLLLGGGMLLFSFTRAFWVLGYHLRRIGGHTTKRGWRELWHAAQFALGFAVLIPVNLLAMAGSLLPALPWQGRLLVLRLLVPLALGFLFVSLLYSRLSPSGHWRSVLPGTIFSLTAWGSASAAFSYFAGRFARYSLLYGSIGVGMMLMVWLNMTAFLLLLGAQVNAVLQKENPGTDQSAAGT